MTTTAGLQTKTVEMVLLTEKKTAILEMPTEVHGGTMDANEIANLVQAGIAQTIWLTHQSLVYRVQLLMMIPVILLILVIPVILLIPVIPVILVIPMILVIHETLFMVIISNE